ncbi:MAG: N-acetyl-gamma-glutamyl-phosphate reductase [Candidatus Omnitrophica bacterium]|nr:N-acetyl-gamma-glutamyl-phosphate reductase [Candidatus Omnitrophota bacterium]
MIKVGIVGATGFAGEELIDILLRHPQVRITSISAKIDKPQKISDIFPKFKGRINLECKEPDLKEIAQRCELVFLALPHTVSMEIVPGLLEKKIRVIDLSADYRLKDTPVYQKHYQVVHKDRANISRAVYGLPELYRVKIKDAQLIANPGCYPTVSILTLTPLVATGYAALDSIIIDAKSGVTGAGRKLAEGFLFSEINEDFKAYKVNTHQHAPEIDQELSKLARKKLGVTFVPHLLPLNRGILATVYVKKVSRHKLPASGLSDLYKKFYKKEPFVRIKETGCFPRLKDVVNTNFCDIAVQDCGDSIILIGAIDNLLKGASGQAVQNMNIMCGFAEDTALL